MQCQPVHAAWDGKGTCMSRDALKGIVLTQAIISVVSDFTFATLPILFLWRVQVDFTTKVGLWVLMCLGYITGSFCLVRTVLNNESIPLDATYGGIVNWVWRLFEVTIGIIAACIPTLRPLYMWGMKRYRGEHTLDDNIRFPLSHEKQNGWTENVENGRSSRSDGDTGGELKQDYSREQLGVQEILMATRRSDSNDRRYKRRDTMRDDLVSEGIIDPEANASPTRPAKRLTSRSKGTMVVRKGSIVEAMGVTDTRLRSTSRNAGSAKPRGSQSPEEPDAMKDELVHDGTVKPGVSSRSTGPPQHVTDTDPPSPLDEEMQRFGIKAAPR